MLDVMIVDDSMTMRNSLKNIFKELDYNIVAEAKSGKEALLKYSQFKPDIITMDVTMPIMNGIEAVKLLSSINPKVNIIMITSHGEEKMVIESIKHGAKGYILKPVTKEKVKENLNRLFVV